MTVGGAPQPMCIYYGQALDAYGLPYKANATVFLRRGTNEIARQNIRGSLSPGVNFALYAHLDDGWSAKNYSSRAVRTGDTVTVIVKDSEGEKTIMEQPVPPVGPTGSQILINVTASQDTDHDGLSDYWEAELIAWSGGALNSIWEVQPGDDFDGDSQTNLEEYRAGTFAFLDYDYFFAERTELTPQHRFKVTFWGVPGKAYGAECRTNATPAVWTACPVALSDTGVFQTAPAMGAGDWLSLYLPVDAGSWFFRLVVK